MPESVKEGDSVLPEGSDIGLGPGDRAFESHYSDESPSEIVDFRGTFVFFSYTGAEIGRRGMPLMSPQNSSVHILTSLFSARPRQYGVSSRR